MRRSLHPDEYDDLMRASRYGMFPIGTCDIPDGITRAGELYQARASPSADLTRSNPPCPAPHDL